MKHTYTLDNVLQAVQFHRLVAVRHHEDTLRQNNIGDTISKDLKS